MAQPTTCGECRYFWQDGFHAEERKGFCLAHAPIAPHDPQPECCPARFPVVYVEHPACGDAKK